VCFLAVEHALQSRRKLNQAGSYLWTGGRYAAAEPLYESSALSNGKCRSSNVPLYL
jgi:hypothetical protein